MISSLDKTLHYMDCVSKGSYHLEFRDTSYDMIPKDEFILRPSTFCKDECLSCGQCCRNYDTVFFPTDLPELERRKEEKQTPFVYYLDNCDTLPITINGEEKQYLSLRPMNQTDSHDIWCNKHTVLNCRWIFVKDDKKLCRIHRYRCITCGFPHMELYQNKLHTTGYLGHKQFGRNWQLGCPVDIKRPLDKETLEDNIYWLTRLQTVADYFGVETYLPEILESLSQVDVDNPPTDSIVFSRSKSKKLFNF